MKWLVIILFFFFLIDGSNENKYYVYQYSVIRLQSDLIKYDCKCYESSFKKRIYKNRIHIQTDSADYTYYIVKANYYGEGDHYLSKEGLPYIWREIDKNGRFYLVISPINFNNKFLYGGDFLAISNQKICE
jgi:hypothetical protein